MVDDALTDTATMDDDIAPTGTITYHLFGPDDPAAPAVSTSGGGHRQRRLPSAPFTAPAPGAYRWIAAYGDDGADDAVAGLQ